MMFLPLKRAKPGVFAVLSVNPQPKLRVPSLERLFSEVRWARPMVKPSPAASSACGTLREPKLQHRRSGAYLVMALTVLPLTYCLWCIWSFCEDLRVGIHSPELASLMIGQAPLIGALLKAVERRRSS